jgi:hypothetical protein
LNSGEITAYSIGSVSIAGQIHGSSGSGSGKILTASGIGSVTIGLGIAGDAGPGSGVISTGSGDSGVFGDNLGSLTIMTGGIAGVVLPAALALIPARSALKASSAR